MLVESPLCSALDELSHCVLRSVREREEREDAGGFI